MRAINGGVCAALGFSAAGIHCGVKNKNSQKKDLALICSEVPCTAAATYTTNRVKAAPLQVTKEHVAQGSLRAVLCNSGNANACAPHGLEYARLMAKAGADALGLEPHQVAVASTGVIGQTLNIKAIQQGAPEVAAALSRDGSNDAAAAIMTTDLVKKEVALEEEIGGKTVRIGGIAKGSGMIHPNMGTMLCFITTDCAIEEGLLQKLLLRAVQRSFNRVCVDGDTSTNDMCLVLANGLAGNAMIKEEGPEAELFFDLLQKVCRALAKSIAADGEGATHLVTGLVRGAKDEQTAETLAMAVISSSLVKAAMFGADANWGRVLCAMGYSGAEFDPAGVDVCFASEAGRVEVCRDGAGLDFDEELAKKVLSEKEVIIEMDLREGFGEAAAWGCDLTYDYVKINGDYRT